MGSGRRDSRGRLRVDRGIREEWQNSLDQRDTLNSRLGSSLGVEQGNAQRAFEMALERYGNLGNFSLNPQSRNTYNEYSSGAFLDPEARRRLRGGGVYDEFSRTGGWDSARRSDYQGQIAAQTPAIYAGLRQNLDRMNAVQGGYSPGYTSQAAKLSRDSARAGAEAVREGNLGMYGSIDEGRRWGTSGMTTSEQALQNILNQGRQWGTQGLTDADEMTGRLGLEAANGLRGLRSDTPGYFNLFDDILENDALMARRRDSLLGRQGDEDSARWDRKGRVARGVRGGVDAIGGGFRTPQLPAGGVRI